VKRIADLIKQVVEITGNIVSFFILAIIAITTYEVVARYAFNAPTNWAWPINKQIFGVFVMVAGSYALIHRSHIRIEMLYDKFSPFMKRVIHWFTLFAALSFLGSLLWKSSSMGIDAWHDKEKMVGVFKLPLYPLKIAIPIGTALFIAACLAVYAGGKEKGDKK
jgi:TRAP-type mannitol/chloroaromatic compound transport system permease small subunit